MNEDEINQLSEMLGEIRKNEQQELKEQIEKGEKVKLPYDIARGIEFGRNLGKSDEELEKILQMKGITKEEGGIFSRKELEEIKGISIRVSQGEKLSGIGHLKNLETLRILPDREIVDFANPDNGLSITDEFGKEISELTKLRNLSILRQSNLHSLDVSNLKQLESLSVVNNITLTNLNGLENLGQINNLNVYGNEWLTKLPGLDKAMSNVMNSNGKANIDMLHMFDALGYNPNTRMANPEMIGRFSQMQENDNLKWMEIFSHSGINGEAAQLTTGQMLENYRKLFEIGHNIPKEMNTRQKTMMAIKHLAKTYRYDYDALANEKEPNGSRTHRINGIDFGPRNGANSSYNALQFDTAVCEGQTKGLQLLLGYLGVPSRNVLCLVDGEQDKADRYTLAGKTINHSILKIMGLPEHPYVDITNLSGIYHSKKMNMLEQYEKIGKENGFSVENIQGAAQKGLATLGKQFDDYAEHNAINGYGEMLKKGYMMNYYDIKDSVQEARDSQKIIQATEEDIGQIKDETVKATYSQLLEDVKDQQKGVVQKPSHVTKEISEKAPTGHLAKARSTGSAVRSRRMEHGTSNIRMPTPKMEKGTRTSPKMQVQGLNKRKANVTLPQQKQAEDMER